MPDYLTLPSDLPVPQADGAGNHLTTLSLPDLYLESTSQQAINLSKIAGWLAIFCYPMTAKPDAPLPDEWDQIPGARGCTPQACSIRDSFSTLIELGVTTFGISTQSSDDQQEAVNRLHLPYILLSDYQYHFIDALKLPTFTWQNQRLNKRLTILALNGKIRHVFYPVFPPNQHIHQVIQWLNTHV